MAKYHENSDQIKLISQCFVKPKYEVDASKKQYHLSPNDLLFLNLDPIQIGFLYSTKPENIQLELLDTLKESVAAALVHFYPLAGRMTTEELPNENTKLVYVNCTKGSGITVFDATVDYTVSDILSPVDVPLISRSFFDLGERTVNHDGHTRSLLSIQVTELNDGVFIGFTMNHSVVDGTSFWEFVNSLSERFLQLTKTKINLENHNSIPIISRNPVFKPHCPVFKLSSKGSIPRNPDEVGLRVRNFKFSSQAISKLKVKANEECELDNKISTFQAFSAFLWMSITRARKLTPETMSSCWIVVNTRPRLNPPLSNNHFGNFVMRDQTRANVGEILEKGLGWTARLIHQFVVSQDANKVSQFYEWLTKVLREGPSGSGSGDPVCHGTSVMITGSPRFDNYGPQFGLGKAEIVLAGYYSKEDGRVFVNAGRDGGGSVDLELCLKAETMDALELDEDFMSFCDTRLKT